MSDGLHHVAAAVSPVTLAGKEWTCRPLTLGDRAEIEAYVVRQRPDVVADALKRCERLGDKLGRRVVMAAYAVARSGDWASEDDVAEYLDSPRGAAHLFYLAVRNAHPEVDSVEKAAEILRDVPVVELGHALRVAVLGVLLPKSVGSPEKTPEPTTQTSDSLGPKSTEHSPHSTDSPLSKSTD